MSTPSDRSGVQSVHRAVDILELVVRRSPVGIRQLADELGLASSTVHGILATLAMRGYVAKSPSGFVLGPRAATLSTHWDPTVSLALITTRATETLAARTGHASTATVLAGSVARILAYTPAPGPITVRVNPSQWREPLSMSTGRLLVALGPRERWDSYIATAADVEPSWDRTRWRTELARVRERRLAHRLRSDPRTESSIAVAVTDADGRAICAVGCSCPSFMSRDLLEPAMRDALEHVVEQIANDLQVPVRPLPAEGRPPRAKTL